MCSKKKQLSIDHPNIEQIKYAIIAITNLYQNIHCFTDSLTQHFIKLALFLP